MIKTISSKPKIEDVMHEVLKGDTLKNGIAFVAWLRENKMSPQWSAANSWKIAYKAHNVCNINLSGSYHKIETGSWRVRAFIGEYENSLLEEFKEIIEIKDRCKAGKSAPAKGLFLTNIIYPDWIFV